jgi:hypothetical protein
MHGHKYEGEFKNDNRHGNGVNNWANGIKYDGEWKDGVRNGCGIFTDAATAENRVGALYSNRVVLVSTKPPTKKHSSISTIMNANINI